MPSDRTALTTLATDLRRLGLNRTADELNDRIAEATRKRWSATVLLEHLVADELEDKQRRSVESRLTRARLGRFKPLADWNWEWPTALDRLALERILTLDFLARGENVILVGAQGLGKTMLAKNIAHQAVLAGHSALFTTAADLLLNLNGQETGRALERRLRHYTRPTLLVIDELGYLAYDARAADLIFQLVSRRYEHRSLLITTNLPFKRWDTVFPNASCAVALIDRSWQIYIDHCPKRPSSGDDAANALGGAPGGLANRLEQQPSVGGPPSETGAVAVGESHRRRDEASPARHRFTLPAYQPFRKSLGRRAAVPAAIAPFQCASSTVIPFACSAVFIPAD